MIPRTSLIYFFGFLAGVVAVGAIYGALRMGIVPGSGERHRTPPRAVLPMQVDLDKEPEITSPSKIAQTATTSSEEPDSTPQESEPVPPSPQVNQPPPVAPSKPVEPIQFLPKTKEYTVFIDTEGFNPKFVTITEGDTVRWINADSELHWPASDPHPTHTGLSEFDPFANIQPGESFTYTFTKIGPFPYHDHTAAVLEDVATITGVVLVCPLEPGDEDPAPCREL